MKLSTESFHPQPAFPRRKQELDATGQRAEVSRTFQHDIRRPGNGRIRASHARLATAGTRSTVTLWRGQRQSRSRRLKRAPGWIHPAGGLAVGVVVLRRLTRRTTALDLRADPAIDVGFEPPYSAGPERHLRREITFLDSLVDRTARKARARLDVTKPENSKHGLGNRLGHSRLFALGNGSCVMFPYPYADLRTNRGLSEVTIRLTDPSLASMSMLSSGASTMF